MGAKIKTAPAAVEKEKRKHKAKWRPLTGVMELAVMNDYNTGMRRNKIMKKHKVTEWQLVAIIKKHAAGFHAGNEMVQPLPFKRFVLNG